MIALIDRVLRRLYLWHERFVLLSHIKWARSDIEDDIEQGLNADPARQAELRTYIEQTQMRIDAINRELA